MFGYEKTKREYDGRKYQENVHGVDGVMLKCGK